MQKAFLNYSQLKAYLKILIDNDLIIYDIKSMRIKATEKGLGLIDTYNQLCQLISEKRKQLQQRWGEKNKSGYNKLRDSILDCRL